MGDLKDKFEVGDRVTYGFDGQIHKTIITQDGDFLDSRCNILKIERPTYEGVYIEEVKFEVKEPELLTEEEKVYLKWILESEILEGVNITHICIKKSFSGDEYEHSIINFSNKLFVELEITCHGYKFDGVLDYHNYTLKELGLEE